MMKKAIKQSTLTTLLNVGSIILILLAVISFVMVIMFSNQVDIANENRFNLTANANRFMNGSAYLTSQVRSYAATGNIEHYDNYWNEINVLKNRDIGVEAIREIGITEEEEALVKKMSNLSNNLVPLESQAMEHVKTGDRAQAEKDVFGDAYEVVIAQIRATQQEFLAKLDERAKGIVDEMIGKTNTLGYVTGLLLLIVCAFQVISMVIIRKKLIKPIIAIEEEMLEIAEGNIHATFKLNADTSEVGMLVYSIHKTKTMLQNCIEDITYAMGEFAKNNFTLREPTQPFVGDLIPIEQSVRKVVAEMTGTISGIHMAANQVSYGAEQVSSGAQSLAQGATEQASAVEELSASLSEISSQVKATAENSSKANSLAADTANAIHASNEHMQKLMAAMNDIHAKSAEISKIINTIEDIAFQTDILALNAAVESARAGEVGKGFAVVADEVRNLAGKSADAAKNTTMLIENSVASIAEGVKLAQGTARELLGTVDRVGQTSAIIAEITKASNDQASSIEQVTVGVDQISTVVQLNSATSQESAAASQELSSQANLLKELVSKFRFV